MQRSKVLLPEPLAPIRQITSPSRAVRETPLSTSILPKRLCRPSTSIMVLAAAGSTVAVLVTVPITGLGASPLSTWTKPRMRWQAWASRSSLRVNDSRTNPWAGSPNAAASSTETPASRSRRQANSSEVRPVPRTSTSTNMPASGLSTLMPGQSARPDTTRSRRRR
ncbi:hypothetical protein D3C79_739080 [compost metagenome]